MAHKRVAVISDTHNCWHAYVLKWIASLNPDFLLHAGDIDNQETLDKYMVLAEQLEIAFLPVRGDHDTFNPELKQRVSLEIDGIRIGLIHGDRPQQRERLSYMVNKLLGGRAYWWNRFSEDALAQFLERLDILVTGHTHVPFEHKLDGTRIINPGAIVTNRRAHHLKSPTLAIIDIYDTRFETAFFQVKDEGLVPLRVGRRGPRRSATWNIHTVWLKKLQSFLQASKQRTLDDQKEMSHSIRGHSFQ